MKLIAPDYFSHFKCTAGSCKHSCCVGWEIDIDEDTYEYYKSIGGEFGKRLSDSIADGEVPCFKLSDNERCPFLNSENLCNIIINLGEDALCQICSDHPRFRNFYNDRIEVGLGLCCEAAAKLILENTEKVCLTEIKNDGEFIISADKAFFAFREFLFDDFQNRALSIDKRINNVLCKHKISFPNISLSEWAEIYLHLERLDEAWGEKLRLLKERKSIESNVSDIETEQLLVYFIYRHLADGLSDGRFQERIAFAILSVHIIRALCAVCCDPVTEIARMYSSEIEYSEENIDALLNILGGNSMIDFRPALENEIPLCMEFIDDARAHQREQGFLQWTDTSPNAGHVIDDVAHERGYLLTYNSKPFGYFCLSFDGEPVYAGIEGKWLNESDNYAVIHRLAFGKAARGKGASKNVFRFSEEICRSRGVNSLRIDTHEDNKKMRHIIEREGFTYCGTVYYNGSPRMAFEKII